MTHPSNIIATALFKSLIEAPPLLDNLPEATTFSRQSLVTPTQDTSLNLDQKLGHLYEDALAALLESTPRYDLQARGIQVRQATGRTLGELDFLLSDLVSNKLIHLELAVKFYLAVETESGFLLPGPDARDNYYRKLDKMRSHQLVLANKYKGLLPDKFLHDDIDVQQLVHGCVFDHVFASKPAAAEFLNPMGRRGKWLHVKELQEYFSKDTLLEIIPKHLWPVPIKMLEGLNLERWQPTEEIDRCVMVRANAVATPFFIAPNGYPGIREC